MERGCEERVRHPMAGDVDHRDAGLALTGPEIPDDVRPARVERVLNPRVEIQELLEIEIDDQIAADRPLRAKHEWPIQKQAGTSLPHTPATAEEWAEVKVRSSFALSPAPPNATQFCCGGMS